MPTASTKSDLVCNSRNDKVHWPIRSKGKLPIYAGDICKYLATNTG